MGRGGQTSAHFTDYSLAAFADQSSKCGRKKRFSKKAHAEAAIAKIAAGRTRIKSHVEDDEMRAYHCCYCEGFHYGNTSRYDS